MGEKSLRDQYHDGEPLAFRKTWKDRFRFTTRHNSKAHPIAIEAARFHPSSILLLPLNFASLISADHVEGWARSFLCRAIPFIIEFVSASRRCGIKTITKSTETLRHSTATSAFFGILRPSRRNSRGYTHQTAKRRADHIQQPIDWHLAQASIVARASPKASGCVAASNAAC